MASTTTGSPSPMSRRRWPDYQARGWRECFRSPVPTGGDVIYLESGHAAAPGFVELLPATPGMDAHFTAFWQGRAGLGRQRSRSGHSSDNKNTGREINAASR